MQKEEKTLKILYVHGYNDRACGSFGLKRPNQQIARELSTHGFYYDIDSPIFPIDTPHQMMEMLDKITEENQYDFIIATDIGAIYAMQIKSGFKILINPAVPENADKLLKVVGSSDDLIDELNMIQDYYFKYCHDEEDDLRTSFLYGTDSEYAANEPYYSDHFKDVALVFHEEMGSILDEKGTEGVRAIIELLMGKYPEHKFKKKEKSKELVSCLK